MNSTFLAFLSNLLLTSILLFSNTVFSEEIPLEAPDWSERKQEGNITIFTRPHTGSNFEAFKAVAVLDAPLSNIMAVMANPLSCTEWVFGCTVSYGFDAESFNNRYAYSVNDMPWPFKDRDYVLHIKTTSKPDSGEILMHMEASENKKEVTEEYLRVSVAQTVYILKALNDGKTEMTWLQHTDPGGVLPGWLVNSLIVDIPVKSLQALERIAQLDKYQDANIVYDEQGIIKGVDSKLSRQTATD